MNIVVCLKQVPATTEVRINPQTNTLIREGVNNQINPFDTYALEEGVRIKGKYGGKVTAISMGPPQAEVALREAIAVGVDDAILLSDPAFAGADTLATSYTLARAIIKIGAYDLIICGRQTFDGDTGQVAPELAEQLGIPFVAYVSKIEAVGDGYMRIQRMVEDGHQVIELSLPGVISVVKEINVPRLPSLRGQIRAKSATIPIWTARDLDADLDRVGLSGSATQVVKIFFPERTGKGELLEGSPEEQAEQLVEKLGKIV